MKPCEKRSGERVSDSELMRALECCSDRDEERCRLCPLFFLGRDVCRQRIARAAFVRIRTSDEKMNAILCILKREN